MQNSESRDCIPYRHFYYNITKGPTFIIERDFKPNEKGLSLMGLWKHYSAMRISVSLANQQIGQAPCLLLEEKPLRVASLLLKRFRSGVDFCLSGIHLRHNFYSIRISRRLPLHLAGYRHSMHKGILLPYRYKGIAIGTGTKVFP